MMGRARDETRRGYNAVDRTTESVRVVTHVNREERSMATALGVMDDDATDDEQTTVGGKNMNCASKTWKGGGVRGNERGRGSGN